MGTLVTANDVAWLRQPKPLVLLKGVVMTTARIENGPSQFQLILALHDDKVVEFTVVFRGRDSARVRAQLWSFSKTKPNGLHEGHCKITGIMNAYNFELPCEGEWLGFHSWVYFTGEYDQRTRTGKVEFRNSVPNADHAQVPD